jgi:hypothetical protein
LKQRDRLPDRRGQPPPPLPKFGYAKPRGITPTIVVGTLSMATILPRIARSPPYFRMKKS